jgi:CheY-like chemotaxis protein
MHEQFHIPTEWQVLVLEDTEDRISWFRQRLPQAIFAKSADEALHALSLGQFKVIFLDHDLHWMHADNSIYEGTGKEVARFLSKINYPGIVVIHSKNDDGVAAMKKYLPDARVARFGDFDIIPVTRSHAQKK